MPIYEYEAKNSKKNCHYCRNGFEQIEKIGAPALKFCPRCGAPVRRIISPPSVGPSKSGLDDRAKSAGFHKFKKLSRGEYEKQY